MRYLAFPLGVAVAGTVVEVALSGSESDVFLVDSVNLAKFKSGQSFHYTGGHYVQSPVRLRVPSRADWTALVIPTRGRVSASARVIRAA